MEALKAYCSNLLSEMEEALFDIRLESPEPKNWSRNSLPVVKGYLDNLKAYIIEHPFKRRSEEIYFFKEVKTVFLGKYIFYAHVYNIEVDRPAPKETNSNVLDYLSDHISEDIEPFFDRNEWLYDYYGEESDVLDSKLFVRKVDDPFTFRELPFPVSEHSAYGDPEFSTGFDYVFAQFRAYEELRDHLENEIEAEVEVGNDVPKEKLKFTAAPGDFIQLVQLLKTVGKPFDPDTGEPVSEEEIAELLRQRMKVDWGDIADFNTLQLVHNNSDLAERMDEALEKLYDKWEEEEGDKEYGGDETDEPEK